MYEIKEEKIEVGINWDDVRIQAAIASLPKIIESVNQITYRKRNVKEIAASRATEYANALVKELQKTINNDGNNSK